MKICPRCQKTYADDNLNFCLEDGSTLTQTAGTPPPTVQMQQPFPTQGQPQGQTAQSGWNVGQQQYSMQPPKKSSKAWIWVLLILGVLVLVCGGGFAGLIYLGSQEQGRQANNTSFNSNSSSFSDRNSNTSTTTTGGRTSTTKLDLAKWEQDTGAFGDTDFADGEFKMSSRMKGYYYVLAGTEDQKSVGADTSVTVRNIDDAATNLGYGLVFHSKTTPLEQGYALLIDAKKKRYRVVHHAPKKETAVINWTKSDAILDGSSENKLEVRDQTGTVDIYINGKKVNSIKNVYGYSDGVVGLYAGDGIKIGFKDLEIRK